MRTRAMLTRACVGCLLRGNRKLETGSTSRFRFHPDSAAVPLDNAFADCQTYPGSRLRVAMQALEYSEDILFVFPGNPDPIVAHADYPILTLLLGANLDYWRIFALVLDGVADQVLKELYHLHFIGVHDRQGGGFEHRPAFFNGELEI